MKHIKSFKTGERKMIDKRDLTDKNLSESNNENKFINYQGNYYSTKKIHIDLLRVGDNGEIKTVSGDYLKRGGFAGTTVFGDSYHSGNKKVTLIEFTEHPIVVNGHTLAVWDGKSSIATVLGTSTLKGNSHTTLIGSLDPVLVTKDNYRLATEKDFDEFRVSSDGYNLKKDESYVNANGEEKNYMFFSNLETIKNAVDSLLSMDKKQVDKILENGHAWATDHIATSKDDIEEVANFLKNYKG